MSSFVKFLSSSLAHFSIGHLIHVWMSLGLNKPIYLDPERGTELQMVSLSYDYISTYPRGWSCFVVESFLIVSAIFLCPDPKITPPECHKVLKLNLFSLPNLLLFIGSAPRSLLLFLLIPNSLRFPKSIHVFLPHSHLPAALQVLFVGPGD